MQLMRQMDNNKSGYIDKNEMVKFFQSTGVKLSPAEASRVFKYFDVNSDNNIQLKEITQMIKKYHHKHKSSRRISSMSNINDLHTVRCILVDYLVKY